MSEANNNTPVEYRTIDRFPGYQFGSDGSVHSRWIRKGVIGTQGLRTFQQVEWKKLKTARAKKNYRRVRIKDISGKMHSCFVHSLILEAFVGQKPAGMECRHFPDRDPSNNRIENLSWGTRSQNFMDKWPQGTMPCGDAHHMTTLTDEQVREIRRRYVPRKVTLKTLSKEYGVRIGTIFNIVSGKTWQWLK